MRTKIMKLVYASLTLLCFPLYAAEGTGLKVAACSVRHKEGTIELSFLLDCTNLTISSNEQLRVQPLLAGDNDTLRLPPLLFTGAIREKVNRRRAHIHRSIPEECEHYSMKRLAKSGQSHIAYSRQIPFVKWMYGSRLILESTVTGCADCRQGLETLPVGYIPRKMAVSYIVPHPGQTGQPDLDEMYLMAQSYLPGSPAFNGLFVEILIHYPDNAIAKNNLAAVALDNGNMHLAKNCLEGIDYLANAQNNRGILLFRQGKTNEARQCFRKAHECGCKEAARNLEEVEIYMTYQ